MTEDQFRFEIMDDLRKRGYPESQVLKICLEDYWMDYHNDERGPWSAKDAVQAEIDEGCLE